MAEETLIDNLTQGHKFDAGPYALDLYRLLAMTLSDQRMAGLDGETRLYRPHHPVGQLQDRFRKAEIMRILISSATVLRILLDQAPNNRLKRLGENECG